MGERGAGRRGHDPLPVRQVKRLRRHDVRASTRPLWRIRQDGRDRPGPRRIPTSDEPQADVRASRGLPAPSPSPGCSRTAATARIATRDASARPRGVTRVTSRPAPSLVSGTSPVTLPPGRARMATPPSNRVIAHRDDDRDRDARPLYDGRPRAVPTVTMTSTLSRTNSAAISA